MTTRKQQADESYAEIGETLAEAILYGGMKRKALKEVVGDMGHESWKFKYWLQRYRDEHEDELAVFEAKKKAAAEKRKQARRAIVDSIAQADPATIPFNRSNLY